MKTNSTGSTGFALFVLVFFQAILPICSLTAWCVNFFKLTQCDFQAPYKGEVIHAVGIIPPFALVTVWFSEK